MPNWVEINLPWYFKNSKETEVLIEEINKIYNKIRNTIDWPKFISTTDALNNKKFDKAYKECHKLFLKKLEMDEKYTELYKRISVLETKDKEQLDFYKHRLRRVGVLIEVKHLDGHIKKHLLGDVNVLGGSCDDCRDIKDEDIVLRAKIVYTQEENDG
jgi:translation elongation factor EF-Ts